MPYELNAREVLFYLNDLGYTDISAQQLKDFMIDLKKLVKYNDRSDPGSPQPHLFTPRNVFDELYNTDTVASRAKSVKARRKESVITVQINRPKCATDEPVCSKSASALVLDSDEVDLSAKGPSERCGSRELSLVPSLSTEIQNRHACNIARMIPPEKKPSTHDKKCRTRPRTSFIRPRLNTKPPKSDPVALYHQYQEQWKKQNIPGTTSHPQVRWCIREKLMGDKFDYCY